VPSNLPIDGHTTGKRQCVVVIRQRDGVTLPCVAFGRRGIDFHPGARSRGPKSMPTSLGLEPSERRFLRVLAEIIRGTLIGNSARASNFLYDAERRVCRV
jgi:hypothetical protein